MFSHSLPETTLPPSSQQKPANAIPLSSIPTSNQENSSLQSNLPPKKVGKWTPEEDDLLRKYVATYSEKQWKKVSEHIPGRTPIQCLHRWTKILKPGLVKGPWTPDEDQKLLAWVKQEGPGKWAQASNLIPGRSGKQCRERWFNNLNPDVKKGNWSVIEDELIFKLYQKYGSAWSKIAKYIPGRTENSIKNRFYSTLRKLTAAKHRPGTESGSPGAKDMESVGKDIKGLTGEENFKGEFPSSQHDTNILYTLLQEIACNEKTPEKKQGNDDELNVKQEEEEVEKKVQEGKDNALKDPKEKQDNYKAPTKLDQAFNLCGEKVVLARDTNLAQHALQETAGKIMQIEVQENDPDFERFVFSVANSFYKVPINLENNTEVIPDFFEDLDLLQKGILDFCSSNIQPLVSAFKIVSLDTTTPFKSEPGSLQKHSPKNSFLAMEQPQTPRLLPLHGLERNQGFRRRQSQQLFDLPQPEPNDIGPLIPISIKIPPLDTKENDNEVRTAKTTPFSKLDLSENIPIFPQKMQAEISKVKLPGVLEQKNLNINQGSVEKDKKNEEMNSLIGSIHDTIGAASVMYSQYLKQIDDAVKSVNKEDPNEAREKLGPLFQQLHGLESWLENAKTDLSRLEGFVGEQKDLSSLVKSNGNAGDENKRRILDENVGGSQWEQLVKKRKVE